jgi:predicted RNA-binding protein with PUA-like domain
MAKRYWLLKCEPNTFSITDLQKSPKQTTMWEGVRNYQARNFLRDGLKVGDGVLFYHSVTDPVGVAGVAEVVKEAYPDPTQFDTRSKYYDSKATKEEPRWFVVDIQFKRAFKKILELSTLRNLPGLEEMMVLRKGSRLSVQPVNSSEWKIITKVG